MRQVRLGYVPITAEIKPNQVKLQIKPYELDEVLTILIPQLLSFGVLANSYSLLPSLVTISHETI